MGAGRPTKYKKKFCKMVYEWLSVGHSKFVVAGKLGVDDDTFYAWIKKYPEFSDSVDRGVKKALEKWELILMAKASGSKVSVNGIDQSAMVSERSLHFLLARRYRKEYGDFKEIDHKSSDGSMTPSAPMEELDLKKLTKEELIVLKETLAKARK